MARLCQPVNLLLDDGPIGRHARPLKTSQANAPRYSAASRAHTKKVFDTLTARGTGPNAVCRVPPYQLCHGKMLLRRIDHRNVPIAFPWRAYPSTLNAFRPALKMSVVRGGRKSSAEGQNDAIGPHSGLRISRTFTRLAAITMLKPWPRLALFFSISTAP